MVLLSLARAAFARQRALYALWLLSLSMAVAGLVTVDVYRQSLTQMVGRQGRKILTADLSLSARRLLTAAELSVAPHLAPTGSQFTEIIEMVAMVSSANESRLSQVRFIEDGFPLFGELHVDGTSQRGSSLTNDGAAWVAPDLLPLLGVDVGSELKIGESYFHIAGVIDKDSSQTLRFGAVLPRIYVHHRHLKGTQLVQFGSTVTHTQLALLPQPDVGLRQKLEAELKDPALEITEPKDLEQGALRAFSRVLDFLGLIGLVTLVLGWVGVFYLGRRWLSLERSNVGLLKCLGVRESETRALLVLKMGCVLVSGIAVGALLSWVLARAVFPWVRASLPDEFVLVWSWTSTFLVLLIGPVVGLLLLLEPLLQTVRTGPLDLLSPHETLNIGLRGWLRWWIWLSVVFVGVTFLQARSWQVTGYFLLALVAIVLIVAAMAFGSLRLIGRRRRQWPTWLWHVSSAMWVRRPGSTVLLVLVSAMASLLAQFVPHLEATLVGELKSPKNKERPALFLVDIQDEQLEPLTQWLAEQNLAYSQRSPFIRARILSVNDQSFERAATGGAFTTREAEVEARFRNRGVNLSYRATLSPSETIVQGKPWSELRVDPLEISVEQGYAERLRLKLDDKITFDVQGVEIAARVANLRRIDWDSFEPNFFIQFPDGVLNEAPKTWIMTLKPSPSLSAPQVQRLLAQKFSNVSSLNVAQTLDNVTTIVRKVSGGLGLASALTLLLGLFVVLMILLFQVASHRRDWAQLRVLGLTRRQIWALQVVTYGVVLMFGGCLSALGAAGLAWILARTALATPVQFNLLVSMGVLLATWLCFVVGLWLISRGADSGLPTDIVA